LPILHFPISNQFFWGTQKLIGAGGERHLGRIDEKTAVCMGTPFRSPGKRQLTGWRHLDLLYYDNRTFYNIARELYVPEALLDFKLRILKHKGHGIDAPYLANGDFLKNYVMDCFENDL